MLKPDESKVNGCSCNLPERLKAIACIATRIGYTQDELVEIVAAYVWTHEQGCDEFMRAYGRLEGIIKSK